MSTRQLVDQFDSWRNETDTMVLVTVVNTAGSTYSKTGRQLLMRADGTHAGLISGGCLEADLAGHVGEVLRQGKPKLVTYDMRDDADDLWGIGLGCNGMMELFLQRIDANHDWQPFKLIRDALSDRTNHDIALIIDDSADTGSCHIDTTEELPGRVCRWQSTPWLRLLILGAAPDAEPVSRLARATGWEVTVADHRQEYLDRNDFSSADRLLLAEPERLDAQLDLQHYDAIVVMSHHLETDRKYLQQLAGTKAHYLGLLGPAKRKQKLLDDLPADCAGLADRLHGPVGLDIGTNSPETIALALIAQIQSLRT